jgi:hypothetical protein
LGDEIVTLYVGSKRKKFTVHKKLLCDRCKFFSTAFKSGFHETKTGAMNLPEDYPNTVASLIDFLYRGTLPKTPQTSNYRPILRLYFLAEKLCMPALTNILMDRIQYLHRTRNEAGFVDENIKKIYDNTRVGSKLRLYCAVCVVCSVAKRERSDEWAAEKEEMFLGDHPEFFLDFFNAQRKYGKKVMFGNVHPSHVRGEKGFGPCEFHDHDDGEICHRKVTNKGDRS